MNISLKMNYTQVLPRSLHATFEQLPGQLKELFIVHLIATNKSTTPLVILALDTIAQCQNQAGLYQNQKNRFFTEFLKEINGETEQTLKKILEVARAGCFEKFLGHIDTKKKEYPSFKAIPKIVEHFYTTLWPALNPQAAHEISMTTLYQESAVQQAYDRLITCRTYFALPKIAFEFLALLQPNQKWKQEVYDEFFDLLGMHYQLKFDDFEKVECCKALFRLHSPLRKTALSYCSKVDIAEFLMLLLQLKKSGGEEILSYYFLSLNESYESDFNKILQALNLLLARAAKKDFYDIIEQWQQKALSWSELFKLLDGSTNQKKLDNSLLQEDIDKRLARFKSDPTVIQPLNDQNLQIITRQYQKVDELCTAHRSLNFNQLMNLAHSIRERAKKSLLEESDRLVLIAIGRLALFLEVGYYLYSTQILALLGILVDGKSWQAQVKTGEGKSNIVALWAFVRAMECHAVDIITSARYLAIRDHNKFAKFFQRCGITTAHICYDQKKSEHFKNQILYAPAFDFEFAWMGDLLWGTKLYVARLQNPYVIKNFDCVCVDESDNLLIDAARNGARLAFPAEVSYEWIYLPILSFVRQNPALKINQIDVMIPLLKKFLSSQVRQENHKVCQQLSDTQLKSWIQSAYHALFELKENVDYVIKIKKDKQGHSQREIKIVDLKTGRISDNSRWSKGIHEFLEVKHGIVVQKESLTAISLSHAVFYDFYKTVVALTGTAERFQTKDIYQIESFDVPPHHPLQRKDLPIIIVNTTQEHLNLILKETQHFIQIGRPLLILCATIQDTQNLADFMTTKKIEHQLLNEIQEELEHVILSRAGAAGKVTIATNAAGRGTDIILTPESLKNSGLHVLLTFYPDSQREEDQAIGRGGRQGQPGSSQIILNKECSEIQQLITNSQQQYSDQDIIDLLNKQRELKEKSQAQAHLSRAKLERFFSKKNSFFF